MTSTDQYENLEHRVDALENWKAAQEALSASKRWIVPIVISIIAMIATIADVIVIANKG